MAHFDEIKAGDQVIVISGEHLSRGSRVATVERVTATQFTAGGQRFMKKTGWGVSSNTYWSATAYPATPTLIATVHAEQRYRHAKNQLKRKLIIIDTLLREIDHRQASHKWAVVLEASLPHLQSAIEALKVRHDEHALPLPSGGVEQ